MKLTSQLRAFLICSGILLVLLGIGLPCWFAGSVPIHIVTSMTTRRDILYIDPVTPELRVSPYYFVTSTSMDAVSSATGYAIFILFVKDGTWFVMNNKKYTDAEISEVWRSSMDRIVFDTHLVYSSACFQWHVDSWAAATVNDSNCTIPIWRAYLTIKAVPVFGDRVLTRENFVPLVVSSVEYDGTKHNASWPLGLDWIARALSTWEGTLLYLIAVALAVILWYSSFGDLQGWDRISARNLELLGMKYEDGHYFSTRKSNDNQRRKGRRKEEK